MVTTPAAHRRARTLGLTTSALWAAAFLGARYFLDPDAQAGLHSPTWLKVTVALLPVLPMAAFLWSVIRGIRDLDELHRRVHLEALVIAFPLAIVFLMTLGLLQLAIDLNTEDWSYRHIWAYLPLFYFIGLVAAWRRYR